MGGADSMGAMKSTGEPMCPQNEWVLKSDNGKPLTMHEQWYWNFEKQRYRKKYLKYWPDYNNPGGNTPMDAIIAPIFPCTAARHRTAKYWGYTAQWNLLDYPVLVFSVTKVDHKKDKTISHSTYLNDMDEYIAKLYDDPVSFENSPVSLGVVGL